KLIESNNNIAKTFSEHIRKIDEIKKITEEIKRIDEEVNATEMRLSEFRQIDQSISEKEPALRNNILEQINEEKRLDKAVKEMEATIDEQRADLLDNIKVCFGISMSQD